MDVHDPGRRRTAGHAGRRGRPHVRDRAERDASRSTPAAGGRSGTSSVRAPRASSAAARTAARRWRRSRVFMVTDNAHVIALNRFTGELLWDTEMDDWRKNYAASSAPLPAGNLVISGVSGGEHGANGFVAAHDQATGKEVWRFWTVPKPGEPGSETWQGKDIEHGGAPTWFTGSYDPTLDIVYWPTGNPSKEYNGVDRKGDNLYANSILALDRKTGALKWHYQFTPHDLWDWDATQTSVLIDADWKGQRAAADAARHAQRLLLRVRSARRQAAAGEAVRQEPDVGERHRRRRPADQAPEPGADACAAPRSARRRTARPTGSRRRSIRRPGSTTCRRSRSAASTRRASRGPWESGKSYLGGIAEDRPRSQAAAHPEGDRHPRPATSMGAAAARRRRNRGAAR